MTDKNRTSAEEIAVIIGHWRAGDYNKCICIQKIADLIGCSLGTAAHLEHDYRTQGFDYYRTHLRQG